MRLGKNNGRYNGETIDIQSVLGDIQSAAAAHGWASETFLELGDLRLIALTRAAAGQSAKARRVYLSSGIHGDEPASPLAIRRLLHENLWPGNVSLWICPCLNPPGYKRNTRENAAGVDLNRDYRHLETPEVRAHVAWLAKQPPFDFALCLHEDWESHGFYVYELNPDSRPGIAEHIIAAVEPVCPIDRSAMIDGRPARHGIIRPDLDPATRPRWAEAFYLLCNKTRQSCTLEAPSDFPLETRVNALVAGVNAALKHRPPG